MTIDELKSLNERITIDPDMMSGKPVIRRMRFPVADVLELLASDMSPEEILIEFPFLEMPDIKAALLFASLQMNNRAIIHAA